MNKYRVYGYLDEKKYSLCISEIGIEPSYFKAKMVRNETATLFDSEKTANAAIDIFKLDNPNQKFDIQITTVFQ